MSGRKPSLLVGEGIRATYAVSGKAVRALLPDEIMPALRGDDALVQAVALQVHTGSDRVGSLLLRFAQARFIDDQALDVHGWVCLGGVASHADDAAAADRLFAPVESIDTDRINVNVGGGRVYVHCTDGLREVRVEATAGVERLREGSLFPSLLSLRDRAESNVVLRATRHSSRAFDGRWQSMRLSGRALRSPWPVSLPHAQWAWPTPIADAAPRLERAVRVGPGVVALKTLSRNRPLPRAAPVRPTRSDAPTKVSPAATVIARPRQRVQARLTA